MAGEAPRVRAIGQAAAGTQVLLFVDAPCTGAPAAEGPADRFGAAGVEVPVPAARQALALRARARNGAGQVSPCSAPLQMRLASARPDATSWKQAGFASLEAARGEWDKVAAAQQALRAALPAAAAAALEKEGLAPVAQLSRLPRSQAPLVSADVDCDGARDHALVALPRSSRLGAALAATGRPADEEVGPLLVELRRVSLDGGAELALLHTRGAPKGGFRVFKRNANGIASAARWAAPKLCLPDAEKRADLAWLAAHGCDAVEWLEGETAGSGYVVWDARGGKLVELPDKCEP